MTVLVDTGVLVAYVHRDDPLHADAVHLLEAVAKGAHGRPLTSDYIVAEGLNFIRRKVRDERVAADFIAEVFGREGIPTPFEEVLRVHGSIFAEALSRYGAHWGAGLSFTDWTSLLLMERHRLDAIATFDAGFDAWARVVR